MYKVSELIDLPVPAAQVWQVVGGFHSLADWLAVIANSVPEEGGRVRRLTTVDGAVIVERLQSFDEAARRLSYSIIEGPAPVTDYLSTLQLTAAAGGAACTLSWSSQFNAAEADAAGASAAFGQLYRGALDSLRLRFAGESGQ